MREVTFGFGTKKILQEGHPIYKPIDLRGTGSLAQYFRIHLLAQSFKHLWPGVSWEWGGMRWSSRLSQMLYL